MGESLKEINNGVYPKMSNSWIHSKRDHDYTLYTSKEIDWFKLKITLKYDATSRNLLMVKKSYFSHFFLNVIIEKF